jgi:predicted PurR-regulated permease PerM
MFQSRTLQMHPAVILVAITAGSSVAGILGRLLSVPMTAAAFGVVSAGTPLVDWGRAVRDQSGYTAWRM